MKNRNHYKICIEHTQNPDGSAVNNDRFEFDFESHDNVLEIIQKLQTRPDLSPKSAAPLGLGIKLFGSVIMENRTNPLFANLFPHFVAFIKNLKQKKK
ncbi:DUF3861 domain-containing protein [Thiomicrorhabdus hydrogeniphila]